MTYNGHLDRVLVLISSCIPQRTCVTSHDHQYKPQTPSKESSRHSVCICSVSSASFALISSLLTFDFHLTQSQRPFWGSPLGAQTRPASNSVSSPPFWNLTGIALVMKQEIIPHLQLSKAKSSKAATDSSAM